jgi:4-amino-4-deoxy-L-arabinose transferase-like glycosyltransferase
VICLGVFLANGRPMAEVDCVAAPYMAWSFVRHGSFDLSRYAELTPYLGGPIRAVPDGAWMSIRPPGAALFAVPIVAPLAAFREQPLGGEAMLQIGKLVGALSVAGAAVFFFLVVRRLAPAAEWPATALFAFGTCLYSVASQALWMHGPAVFCLCSALWLLTGEARDRPRVGVLTGALLGLGVLTRPTTAFFVVAAVTTLLLQRRWRTVLWLAAGGVIPAIVLFHYNWSHFGSAWFGGYQDDQWTVSPPFWLGVGGLLIAPSRGLFVYSPALVLALPAIGSIFRRSATVPGAHRSLVLSWCVASVVTLLFFGRWHDWHGGWCFGPRFLSETMPTLCLLFAFGYARLAHTWSKRLATAAVGLSIAIQLVGVFGYSGYAAWNSRHPESDGGRSLFDLRDTQIAAHARAAAKAVLDHLPGR